MFIIKYLDKAGVELVLCRVLSEQAAESTVNRINSNPKQCAWYEPCDAIK